MALISDIRSPGRLEKSQKKCSQVFEIQVNRLVRHGKAKTSWSTSKIHQTVNKNSLYSLRFHLFTVNVIPEITYVYPKKESFDFKCIVSGEMYNIDEQEVGRSLARLSKSFN